jgi:group I intron endonuclease
MSARAEVGIYRITQIGTSRHYVGSAINIRRRWSQHRAQLRSGVHHSVKLQRAWSKHGEDSFEFVLVEVVADRDALLAREQHWIEALAGYGRGFNSCPIAGRSSGYEWTDEQRRKASESKKGKTNFTEEHRARISESLKGQVFTDERKEKIRAKALERVRRDPDGAGAGGRAQKGKKWSEEFRAKMMAARAGVWTEERRKAAGERAKGRKHTEESKAKIAASNARRGVSEQTKEKMRLALTGRKLSADHAEKSRRGLAEIRRRRYGVEEA